jgi:glycosyltransferase involved in cell wall biosynthesis
MVLIEAMSQGAACIACDYKGRQREIIQDDSQGLCVECENEEALASALSRMIEDEGYRRQVQENGWKRSHDFTPDKIGENWMRLLGDLLERQNRS